MAKTERWVPPKQGYYRAVEPAGNSVTRGQRPVSNGSPKPPPTGSGGASKPKSGGS
jgi:hypothetical protein